jgi:S-adenosylmethionine hydrolase
VELPAIVLLTDFGIVDPFVGVMKGVILSRCPRVPIVDLTHAIPPQAVGEGAFWLERAFRWFTEGTIFVAVVDPGVGTARRALAIEAHDRLFLGPDNGLLMLAISSDPARRVHAIDTGRLGLPEPSRTFHGRDVFAPVAAELASRRMRVSEVGPTVSDASPPASGAPLAVDRDEVSGAIITIDRFGNLISNIPADSVEKLRPAEVEVGTELVPLGRTYSDVAAGDYVALVNAFSTVEVAQRDGNAAAALGLGRGARVVVRRVAAS